MAPPASELLSAIPATLAGAVPRPGPARDAVAIAEAGIAAVDGFDLVTRSLQRYMLRRRLGRARRVYCIALGKAANPMLDAVAEMVPQNWAGGIAVSTESGPSQPRRQRLVGGHPLPDKRSLLAAVQVERFVASADLTAEDLVVVCVSGGTSSIVLQPVPPLTISDVRVITLRLLRSGADVTTINRLRRVVSSLHGGGLTALVAPAPCLGLILTDNVQVGTPAVGSGPTFPLGVTQREANEVLDLLVLPETLRHRAHQAIQRRFTQPLWRGAATNIVVGRPLDALVAARERARSLGYRCIVLSSTIQGEAREVAKVLGAVVGHRSGQGRGKTCVLAAGEVVVTVRGRGKGGRCQELAWAMAPQLKDQRGAAFAAVATDGRDYLKGVGGAWVESSTFSDLAAAGLDWARRLEANDSYSGLLRLGLLLPETATHTNLCDLYVACVDPAWPS